VDERLPQFLHRPVQILWFDSQEFIVVMSVIFVAVIVGGIIGWRSSALFSSSFPGSGPSRAVHPHLAWRWGLARFRNYPGPTQTRFFE
jgi:hypothetical protein